MKMTAHNVHSRGSAIGLVVVVISVAGAVGLTAQAASPPQSPGAAPDSCTAPANRIVAENCRAGNPREEWDVYSDGDPNIQGFATDMSVNVGETVRFKIKTHSPQYRIDIYRMGWYRGQGARLVQTVLPSASLPQAQPECRMHTQTRLVDCGNWKESASWEVPDDAVSGVYAARLVREDDEPEGWQSETVGQAPMDRPPPGPQAYGALGLGQLRDALIEKRASHMIFVVRDDAGASDILLQTSDPTWVAFNRFGGSSLYGSWPNTQSRGFAANLASNLSTRAYMVSYNRPLATRGSFTQEQFFNNEYPLIRWLERNGFDVSYFTGVDSARRGEELLEHRVFMIAGHDNFWSGSQREYIETARDAGVHLAFLGGGMGLWRSRWHASNDGTNTPFRTLVSYKETHADGKLDPVKEEWTGTWRDSREFNPFGAQPENALTGTLHTVGGFRNDPLVVPATYARHRFWRNTDVAALSDGERVVLGKGILGHVWDQDIDNGFRPEGLMHLSETSADNVAYLQDLGTLYDSGTATHHLTLYRAQSGAFVFSAGAPQFSWGLDNYHTNWTTGGLRVRPEISGTVGALQQAMVNLLADMGVEPGALSTDLVLAEASQDRTAPRSNIIQPQAGTVVASEVTIKGTAADSGGVVSAVEVSLDGGKTWRAAEGTTAWEYTWNPVRPSARFEITSRAVDDSGNLEVFGDPIALLLNPTEPVRAGRAR